MRRNGSVTSARGLVPFGHLGWAYRGSDDFEERAAEYLADGLRQNQLTVLVGLEDAEKLQRRLERLPGGARALADGKAAAAPLHDFVVLDADGIIDSAASVDRCVAAVDDAIARGFAGLRLIIDVTSLAQTPRQRDALAEFEHCIDQQMVDRPFGSLCAYDLDQLGEAAAELVCLHPLTDPTAGHFRLFATEDRQIALNGEFDLANRALFKLTASRLLTRLQGEVVIDLADVSYLEHNALIALDQIAGKRGAPVVLRNADLVVTRVISLLHLDHVHVENG